MRETSPEQLVRQLAGEPLRPAYLVAGPETLRVLEAADAVRAAARAQGATEREVFEPDGRDLDWDAVAATLQAPGLFAPRRIIELRLPTGKPGKAGEQLIRGFCDDPPPDVVLLVTGHDWSRQHGGAWAEAIARVGQVAIAWKVKPHELADWIERRLRDHGVRVDREAVQCLAERVDGNLLAAAQEVDKLALLGADREGEVLDAASMQALVADSARFDVFRLVDAALNGQPGLAARMLAGLRAEGEAVPALLGMLTLELGRGAALARVAERGGNLAGEFKAQRIWDSKQAVYRRALQRHASTGRWEAFLAQAGEVDRIAKGRAPGDAWQRLERLLLALANTRAARVLEHRP